MSTAEKIYKILEEIRPDQDFRGEANFLTDGLLDSVDITRLVVDIEDAFGITIPADEMIPENYFSAASIEQLINRSLEEKENV